MNSDSEIGKIKKIAIQVRNSCEVYVKNDLIFEENQLDTTCGQALDCFCGIASAFLQRMLSLNDIPAVIVTGQYDDNEHAWVETADHIIDLTLTQFKRAHDKVTIIGKHHEEFKKLEEGTDLEFLFDGWPEGQIPTAKRLEQLEKIHASLPPLQEKHLAFARRFPSRKPSIE